MRNLLFIRRICLVGVCVVHIREHHRITLVCQFVRQLGAGLAHSVPHVRDEEHFLDDCRRSLIGALGQLLPSCDFHALFQCQFGHPPEILLVQVLSLPSPTRNLVASDMDSHQRHSCALIDTYKIIEDSLHEGVDAFHLHAHNIIGVALGRVVFGIVGRVLKKKRSLSASGHSLDGGTAVTRSVEFRNYAYASVPRVLQYLDIIFLSIESIGQCRRLRVGISVVRWLKAFLRVQ